MSEEAGRDRVLLRVVVRGRVQGVGFRAWTQHQAQLHGLEGWVRNLSDGSVEAMLAGPAERLELMLKALREGPKGSRVEAVEEYPATEAEFGPPSAGRFEIRRTA
ncbi:acylphosphatase [Enterovirga aerilata]|uniref:Acylphosphatase n=1 Tax=Enterovirga aerilata TaxID=2730920 RepID=A0A849I911_9HYPH|nr:acylphosphatase [Enterovirga sp. DB1703]NNM72899.1 acylphosphatase [Enterovirga sp. DB1703]